jgi:hypothetical protein
MESLTLDSNVIMALGETTHSKSKTKEAAGMSLSAKTSGQEYGQGLTEFSVK